MSQSLKLAPGLELPLDVVTRRTAIVGQTGTGKTSTAVVMVEEAHEAGARYVVLDPTGAWYGLKSSADGEGRGLDCVVMGGQHGDVPLDEHSGRVVGELVANEGYNLVLDLSRAGDRMASWGARQRFVADFLTTLYELAHSQVLVVIDEAHRFAPQRTLDESGHAARCLGAVIDVVALGRRKGLAAAVITQRLARLHKDVLELCEVMVAHRLRGTNDLKALKGWIEETGQDTKAILNEISGLALGRARVSAPTLGVNGVYAIRRKHTFDSSRSIEVGEVAIEPKVRAQVDLGALERLMADTLERQREDDPERLRERIRELEHERDEIRAAGSVETTESGLADAEDRVAELHDLIAAHRARIADLERHAGALRARTVELVRDLDAIRAIVGDAGGGPDVDQPATPRGEGRDSGRSVRRSDDGGPETPSSGPEPTSNGDGPLIKAGAWRMLEALYRAPRSLTRAELGTLAVVRTGGTMSDYLSALRGHGYIDEADGRISLTAAGGDAAGHRMGGRALALAPGQIVAPYERKLKAGARRMLDHLMRAHPDGYTRAELGRLANVATGGTFSDYLSSLKTRGLAEEHGRRVFAGSVLYLWQDEKPTIHPTEGVRS